MGVLYRIACYIGQAVESLKWNMNEIFCPEKNRKIEQSSDIEIDSADLKLIKEEVDEIFQRIDVEPELVPEKTMLFLSRPEEHGCNFLTAFYYRKRIIHALEWAQQRGISTFLADYCTAFGLLAMETLLKMRDKGADIRVYAITGRFFGSRKTYRLIKEPAVELAILATRADYAYSLQPERNNADVFPRAGIQCSETGICAAKDI